MADASSGITLVTAASLISLTTTALMPAPAGWYWAPLTKEGDALLDGRVITHSVGTQFDDSKKTEVISLYAQADYDLTDTISMYAEFLHSSRETTLRSTRQFWTGELGYRPISVYNCQVGTLT